MANTKKPIPATKANTTNGAAFEGAAANPPGDLDGRRTVAQSAADWRGMPPRRIASESAAPPPVPVEEIFERVTADPTPAFHYKAHPSRIQFVELEPGEWHLLYLLGKEKHVPGLNNVSKEGHVGDAFGATVRRGWVLIPWEKGPGGKSYCRAYETIHGQPLHTCCFSEVYQRHYSVPAEIRPNPHALWRWTLDLVEDGTLPAIDRYQAESFRTRRMKTLEIIIAKGKNPMARGRAIRQAAKAQRELDALDLMVESIDWNSTARVVAMPVGA